MNEIVLCNILMNLFLTRSAWDFVVNEIVFCKFSFIHCSSYCLVTPVVYLKYATPSFLFRHAVAQVVSHPSPIAVTLARCQGYGGFVTTKWYILTSPAIVISPASQHSLIILLANVNAYMCACMCVCSLSSNSSVK